MTTTHIGTPFRPKYILCWYMDPCGSPASVLTDRQNLRAMDFMKAKCSAHMDLCRNLIPVLRTPCVPTCQTATQGANEHEEQEEDERRPMPLHSWQHNIWKVGRCEKDKKAPHARKKGWKISRTLLSSRDGKRMANYSRERHPTHRQVNPGPGRTSTVFVGRQ